MVTLLKYHNLSNRVIADSIKIRYKTVSDWRVTVNSMDEEDYAMLVRAILNYEIFELEKMHKKGIEKLSNIKEHYKEIISSIEEYEKLQNDV